MRARNECSLVRVANFSETAADRGGKRQTPSPVEMSKNTRAEMRGNVA